MNRQQTHVLLEENTQSCTTSYQLLLIFGKIAGFADVAQLVEQLIRKHRNTEFKLQKKPLKKAAFFMTFSNANTAALAF